MTVIIYTPTIAISYSLLTPSPEYSFYRPVAGIRLS